MKVFISHIGEESPLALSLKEWIENSFAGKCEVFVSSDRDDIPPGNEWFANIDAALESAAVLIVLCSPSSLGRPWINFETGCGWMKRVPIIPLCHSGQEKGALPQPIARFQALNLDDRDSPLAIIQALAKHLGFPKVPRIDEAAMKRELEEARKGTSPPVLAPAALLQPDNVTSEMFDILKLFTTLNEQSRLTAAQLAGHFSMPQQRMQYFLEKLRDQKLILAILSIGSPATYMLSKEGREYLFKQGAL